MKLTVLLAALPLAANAWVFNACGHQYDGPGNHGCTKSACAKGGQISWDVGVFSSCTLRVYSDAGCKNQAGIASKDWDKKLDNSIGSFDVADC